MSPGHAAAWWCAEHLLDFVRLMVKFEELDKDTVAYDRAVDRFDAARQAGVRPILVTDMFNRAAGPGDYHKRVYLPRDMVKAVERMLIDTKPWAMQVMNEAWVGNKNLLMEEYAEFVYAHILAAKRVGWDGLLIGQQPRSGSHPGKLTEAWIWHVDPAEGADPDRAWSWCAEGSHHWDKYTPPEGSGEGGTFEEFSTMVHSLPGAEALHDVLSNLLVVGKRRPVGWHWPEIYDEVSPVGKQVHINSPEGAAMVRVVLEEFTERKIPWGWLSIGGGNPWWGQEPGTSGWGLNTDMVNSEGKFSLGGLEICKYKGKTPPDFSDVDDGDDGDDDADEDAEPLTNVLFNLNKRADALRRQGKEAKHARRDEEYQRIMHNFWKILRKELK